MTFHLRTQLLIWSAVLLCQCGVPRLPQCSTVPLASRAPATTLIDEAHKHWRTLADPNEKSQWPAANAAYNNAVAKLFDQLRCGPGGWDSRAAAIGTRIAPPGPGQTDLDDLDVVFPAAAVKGHVVRTNQITPGVGVSLVGWRKTSPVGQQREKYLLPNGLPYNITTALRFDHAGTPVWHFFKRWKQEEVSIGSSSHPLAADWSAPNSFYWMMCELDNLKIQNVILPDRFNEETGVYFVTPYDPEKIPVVFVHGLVSSPDAFKNLINELAPQPWFRKHYQIWLFNYPTGNSWAYSSMRFREAMRDACAYARSKGHDRNLNRMVLVGHSMGGLVSRSSVTDPGDVIYNQVFKLPVEQLNVSPKVRRLIQDTLLYKPLTEPSRVVFMAVPHRGSPMATMRASGWISKLIRLPKTLTVELLDSTALALGDIVNGDDPSNLIPTSINSLSPRNHTTIGLNKAPLPKHVTFHSVIGDRGKGDTPDSSDGVVPYWSSHLDSAASELIVPSNHSVPDHPDAARELERILQLHLNLAN